MRRITRTFGVAAILATVAAIPVVAQTQTAQTDPGLGAARNAAIYLKAMPTKAAEQMSEEDYAFKMTDARAHAMVEFGKRQMPAVTVLIYRSHHTTLHYGNVITYMRLRGKVPPSSAEMPSD